MPFQQQFWLIYNTSGTRINSDIGDSAMNVKIPNQLSTTIQEKFEQLSNIKQSLTRKNSSDNKKEPKELFAQDLIEVEEILGGFIITRSGSVIKILEILPLNFDEFEGSTRDKIANNFGFGLKRCTKIGHIKIMRSSADITPFVTYVREQMKNETNPKLRCRVEDYINHTLSLQSKDTKRNRFFFIFEYEGDSKGKKSSVWKDIYEQMMQTTADVTNALKAAGNIVIDYYIQGNNGKAIADIFYSHYNPKTSKTEDIQYRINKLIEARNYMAENENKDEKPTISDIIAPRGIHFGKFDYCVMDGTFHTYLALKDSAYPLTCFAGDITKSLMFGLDDCDLDIFYKQKPREATRILLDRVDNISRGVAFNLQGDDNKVEALNSTASNAKYIKNCLDNGDEDIYDVCTILTLRAPSLKELRTIRDSYIKKMKTSSYYFEDCFMKTQEYWKMVQPLCYINSTIFRDNSRNMTNSSIAAMYCFTSYEMFDKEGFVLGRTGGMIPTLLAINNFDEHKYPNPHISLFGTTGAGKTYTELMLTSRMRMHGVRLVYILPLKGHEYRDAILSMGGEFVSLRPGGKACVNIMEIRPEATSLDSKSDDKDIQEYLDTKPSYLAQKITSLITWFRLLVNEDKLTSEEDGELNSLLVGLYNDFGITDDNESIWEESNHLKKMPIIEDLFVRLTQNPLLSKRASVLKAWVSGNCKNMNNQTNVNLNNKCIAFDINEDFIGEELLPAFMYIAFDCGYSICKLSNTERCAIALDEVWKLMAIPKCASQIYKMIKILRSYKSCAIAATQDIEDCLKNDYGEALLTNSAIKIFLKVNLTEMEALEKAVTFSPENKSRLLDAGRGVGFITFNTERVFVNFLSSELEEELYTTKAERKKELNEKRKRLGLYPEI